MIAVDPSVDDFFHVEAVARVVYLPRTLAGRQGANAALVRVLALRRRLTESEPTVVISFLWRTNVLTLVASIGSHWKTIVSERNDPWQEATSDRWVWSWLRKQLYKKADGAVANTTGAIRYLEQVVGITNPYFIPNAVHSGVESRVSAAAIERPRAGPVQVLAVGRLTRQKGYDVLLSSWSAVVEQIPTAQLVVVGDGPDRSALQDAIEQHGIAESVVLVGAVSDVTRYYARATVFVLTSRWEGFPNVLLEAMSGGLPCVASKCSSGVTDCLGDAGVLVPPNDPERLSETIIALLRDGDRRDYLGKLAKERAELFNPDRVFSKWEDLIDSSVSMTDVLLVVPRAHTNLNPVKRLFEGVGRTTRVLAAQPTDWPDDRRSQSSTFRLIQRVHQLKPKFVVVREVAHSAGRIGWYCRLCGIKYALLSQESSQRAPGMRGTLKAVYGWVYRIARFGVLKTYTPILPKTHHGRLGFVSFNYPMPTIKAKPEQREGAPVVLMIGKLAVPRKRHEDVIKALVDLPYKSKLKIVGSSNGNRDCNARRSGQYFQRIVALDGRTFGNTTVSVSADVPFESMESLYSHADIFVLPASDEPFSVSLLEAMAAGCAVITTAENGSACYVTHGVDGFVYPAGDTARLGELLEHLLADMDETRAVGKNAQRTAWAGGDPRYPGMVEAFGVCEEKI